MLEKKHKTTSLKVGRPNMGGAASTHSTTLRYPGEFVPDKTINKLVLSELAAMQSVSWLLDGFPRTVPQAEVLAEQEQLHAVINLDVPAETIIARVKERWIHQPSGRVYNLSYNPPKVPGRDDITGLPCSEYN